MGNQQRATTIRIPNPQTVAGEGGGLIGLGRRLVAGQRAVVDDPASAYLIELDVAAVDGHLVAQSVCVRQRAAGYPVTTSVLRWVAVDRMLREVRNALAENPLLVVTSVDRRQRTGARRPQQDWLPSVADIYRAARDEPTTHNRPTETVAERLGLSRSHAARLVGHARRAGLLGPAAHGRAGERASIENQA